MRLVHLSDLHFGRHDARLAEGLAAEIAAHAPDLVVVSGDFAQIGSIAEFRAARAFLDTLSAPVFAVPGNHDVPARNLIARFADPFGRFRRFIASEIEPFLETGGIALAGINTARRLRLSLNWADGAINQGQLDRVGRLFGQADPAAIRIVVAHHPLVLPGVAGGFRVVKRADLALRTLARLGVRLVLSGHFHLSYVRRHGAPDEVAQAAPPGPRRAAVAPMLVAQASSTISTRLRGEPNAYNLIDIEGGEIDIQVREWSGAGWRTREDVKASEVGVPIEPNPTI